MTGQRRSAFIFSILPAGVRARVAVALHAGELNRLDAGMKELTLLESSDKRAALARFVGEMRSLREKREQINELSMIASLSVMMILLAGITITAFISGRGIDFAEAILAGGGIHCVLLPLVMGYCRAELNIHPLGLLFESGNRWLDAALSLCAALFIAAAFVAVSGISRGHGDPIVSIFTLAAAATAGPMLEEIVFRHLLFTVLGKRIGPVVAGAVSSLLFAIIHLPDGVPIFLAYTAAGAMLCLLRHIRRSLFPALASHAMANVIILLS